LETGDNRRGSAATGEDREAYSNAPHVPKVQMGGDPHTVAKKKAAKKAKKKK
jgi:hypothetical protein